MPRLFKTASWSTVGACLSGYFGWWTVLAFSVAGLLFYPRGGR